MKKFKQPIGAVIRAPHAEVVSDGMTKIEYFTATAMAGILANPDTMKEATKHFERQNPNAKDPIEFAEAIGRLAIMYAKGALIELEIEEGKDGKMEVNHA